MKPPSLEQQLIDIYPVSYTPFWHKPLFYIPAIIVSSILVGLFIYWLITIFYHKKTLTPSQQARKQLNKLKQQINSDFYQQFYFSLTSILKQYLEGVLGGSYMSKTDQEVIIALNQVDFPVDLRETIDRLFAGSQTIKFASQQAAVQQMHHDIKTAMNLIEQSSFEQSN